MQRPGRGQGRVIPWRRVRRFWGIELPQVDRRSCAGCTQCTLLAILFNGGGKTSLRGKPRCVFDACLCVCVSGIDFHGWRVECETFTRRRVCRNDDSVLFLIIRSPGDTRAETRAMKTFVRQSRLFCEENNRLWLASLSIAHVSQRGLDSPRFHLRETNETEMYVARFLSCCFSSDETCDAGHCYEEVTEIGTSRVLTTAR